MAKVKNDFFKQLMRGSVLCMDVDAMARVDDMVDIVKKLRFSKI